MHEYIHSGCVWQAEEGTHLVKFFFSFHLLKEKQLAEREDASSPQDGFLPSISLVSSLPVRPDSCIRLNTTRKDWNKLAIGGRQMEESIKPGQILHEETNRHVSRPLSARFHVSLACDKEAGRPFQRYLERSDLDIFLLGNAPHVGLSLLALNVLNV